jgi:hypothetical protein
MDNENYLTKLEAFAKKVDGSTLVKVVLDEEFTGEQISHPINQILLKQDTLAIFYEPDEPSPTIDLQNMKVIFPRKDVKVSSFISTYVNESLNLLQGKNMSLDYFYSQLWKAMDKKTSISKNDFTSLNHPFHWSFFNDSNHSPFEMYWSESKDKTLYSRLKREPSAENKGKLIDHISKNYQPLILARSKNLESVNILDQ